MKLKNMETHPNYEVLTQCKDDPSKGHLISYERQKDGTTKEVDLGIIEMPKIKFRITD